MKFSGHHLFHIRRFCIFLTNVYLCDKLTIYLSFNSYHFYELSVLLRVEDIRNS